MPIKLLPKQEISRLQAEQKRAIVSEGMKLARRVDNLREIAAQEEASLASFRSATLKAIKNEIASAKQERDGLLSEVVSLRKEIESGTVVLNEREKSLVIRETAIQERESEMEKRVFALSTLTESVKLQEKENTNVTRKLKNVWDVLVTLSDDVKGVYQQAQSYLDGAIARATQIAHLAQEVEQELKTRDIAVASRERDVIIKQEHIVTQSEELAIERRQLADMRGTLERAFKRLDK